MNQCLGFGTKWGWVITEFSFFGWTIPLTLSVGLLIFCFMVKPQVYFIFVYFERVAFQSILHLMLCANMGTLEIFIYIQCSVFPHQVMTDNKCFWTLLNQSWAVSYPLAHKRLSMWASVVVVAVSAILLLLFHLFSFVFYCETTAWDGVANLWKNGIYIKYKYKKDCSKCSYILPSAQTNGPGRAAH